MKKTCLFTAFFLLSPAFSVPAGILAVVNDDIVSDRDFDRRADFIRLTNQADPSRKDIRDRILKQLIDEKLKQQAARAAGVAVSDDEVDNAVRVTLRQNGLDYDAVVKLLRKNDLPLSVIEDQIKSDLLFLRAVKKTEGHRAEVTERDVDAKIGEIKEQSNQKHYLVSEILLPVDSPDRDGETYGLAMSLIMRLRDGEAFEDIAKRYSARAEPIWVGEKTLSPAEKEELSVMREGQLSQPVKTAEGYKLIVLHAVRDPESPDERQKLVRLTQMFLPDGLPAEKRAAALRDANMTRGSCDQFARVAEELKTTPRVDLGKMPENALPAPIRAVVARAGLLEPTAPLPIEGGDLVFMVCSRETASALPAKDEIRARIESDRIETLAQRRLRELRRAAVTEIRQ
ncbi:MAG TPA: hypothetical protein DCX19_03880 [Alphaproteobacteria bacterium]|nr:hypothetical protein [Alphaproteobacteria bacterium]